jgi:DNA repair protein RecO (recombination protein O)
MKIIDQGIILTIKKYSENSLIVKILSEHHGIYSGFVRKPSKKDFSIYQNFNLVDFEWAARTEENLGFFKIELKKSFLGHIISSPIYLVSFETISTIIGQNLLEREPATEVFFGLLNLLQNLNLEPENFLQNYIKFEIKLLQTLGYGIDLSECAASGVKENLSFVSPKSARAVCMQAGEKYKDKLLILPQFLVGNEDLKIQKEDLINGLKLTGFFIEKYLTNKLQNFSQKEIFNSRYRLMSLIARDPWLCSG